MRLKVRIKRVGHEGLWYYDKVGNEYLVDTESDSQFIYTLVGTFDRTYGILCEDCEIIPTMEPLKQINNFKL